MATTRESILIVTPDAQINFLLERMLKSFGYAVNSCTDQETAKRFLDFSLPTLMIISEKVNNNKGIEYSREILTRYPAMPILLFVTADTPELLKTALRLGISDYLCLPLTADEVLRAIQNSLQKSVLHKEWVIVETRRATAGLQRRMGELEVLARLGRSITGSLDIDSVFSAVVDAAVELTNAEEGSLLLLDDETGELYMRAARNFQEEFVRTFRLPINDTLAGGVIRTGQAVLLDENTPQKIKTAYLVHSLLYVPLQIQGRTVGVLGVDNRQTKMPFKDHDVKLLGALAEYAVIAMENARLYANINIERNKLETILTRIHEGVLIVDTEGRFLLVNATAQAALTLPETQLKGRPVKELLSQPDLLELLETAGNSLVNRVELTVEDGRSFSAQITAIPDLGSVVTLHDITSLKKLDRIKSEFVSTVSHDLRSPLTAILGYTELIDRAGPVTDLQKDFIHRVQTSVHNITHLVDDLINLGRIEAGFDSRKETLYLDQIVRYSLEGAKKHITVKNLRVKLDLPDSLPPISGNPIQIRQTIDHLIDNAVKYTAAGGSVTITGRVEDNQIILQFADTGIGIPSVDLPYIFDKFYRGANTSGEAPGSGLGLAIVKSVVESHQGRYWVDSTVGMGSTFTIVLPIII